MTRLYGLIGFPLGHSRSADYFNNRFQSAGLNDALYRLFPIPALHEIHHVLERHPDLRGLNVTIPYKEKIIPLLTGIDEVAREIGSVNVVLIRREKGLTALTGYNTDADGFLAAFPERENHRRALVLGTGGAAKAVAWALRKTGIQVMFVSRSTCTDTTTTYKTLHATPELVREHTLIVNATPAGMFPHTDTLPDIPYELIGPEHLLYDLVYNPEMTLFLQKGVAKRAQVRTGEQMFLHQADLTYSLFTR